MHCCEVHPKALKMRNETVMVAREISADNEGRGKSRVWRDERDVEKRSWIPSRDGYGLELRSEWGRLHGECWKLNALGRCCRRRLQKDGVGVSVQQLKVTTSW